jgi:hypothetical protein
MKKILMIPPRITALLTHYQGRVFKIILMILVLITALYTKEYRGEHQAIINNNIGGVFYVLFGSLFFSAAFPRLRFYWPVVIAFTLTCLLECVQYFQFPFMVELTRHKTMAYLFGLSFNPVDFIYYFVGGMVALGLLGILETDRKKGRGSDGARERKERVFDTVGVIGKTRRGEGAMERESEEGVSSTRVG